MAKTLSLFEQAHADQLKVEHAVVEDRPQEAASYGIFRVPTLVVLRDGKVLEKSAGELTSAQLDAILTSLSKSSPPDGYFLHSRQTPEGTVNEQHPVSSLTARALTPTVPPPRAYDETVTPDATKNATRSASEPKSNLRYDGKTFNEWRTLLKTELSTEKRIEAIKALAAFGASGYGKEAAEAILGVAEQLDWTSIDNKSSAGKLKTACLEALTGGSATGGYHIPIGDWLLLVVDRLKSKSAPWPLFSSYLFPGLPAGEQSAVAPLLELSKDPDLAMPAWRGLKAVDPQLENANVLQALRDALASPDQSPERLSFLVSDLLVNAGSSSYGGTSLELRYVPELDELLFHPNRAVRWYARNVLSCIQPDDAPGVVKQLLATVDDPARKRDRIEAIRALAAIGPLAKDAEPKLLEIAHSESDPARIPAVVALIRIQPSLQQWPDTENFQQLFGEAASKELRKKFGPKLDAEQENVPPPKHPGGGGGIF